MPPILFEAASMGGNLVEYFEVRRAIRTLAPTFLYKRHARNDVAALWAARRAGVPAVLEVNCLFTGPGYREFEPAALESIAVRLERWAMRLATWRLAVSTPLARLIEALASAPPCCPTERIRRGSTLRPRARSRCARSIASTAISWSDGPACSANGTASSCSWTR
jgi:hypothetical protein